MSVFHAGQGITLSSSALASKEKVRSALNRATRTIGHKVATASDEKYLYVWNIYKSWSTQDF
jgi:hypothetical protein